jgi:hypothetical protein
LLKPAVSSPFLAFIFFATGSFSEHFRRKVGPNGPQKLFEHMSFLARNSPSFRILNIDGDAFLFSVPSAFSVGDFSFTPHPAKRPAGLLTGRGRMLNLTI